MEIRRHRAVNLLLINYEYPPAGGGAANATQFLGRALSKLGHPVHVLTSGLRHADGVTHEAGLQIHRLPIGRARADRASQWEMLKFMTQSRAAALRLGQEHAISAAIAFFTIPSGPAALHLQRRAKVPYVISLRGGDVPGHVPSLGLRHALTAPLRRAVLKHARALVANSEGLAATSRAADPYPVQIIPNGVDCQFFHPADDSPARPASGPFRILFVGRVHPEKNLAAVIRQIAPLPDALRVRTELIVAGDGAERSELTALAARLGLARQIRWLGWQGKDKLPALYRSVDVLVNPSLYEGMPNAVLEAMASGLPVIASDVPGNRSVVEPGVNGLLFPLGRPADLAAALIRLADDPALARTMGMAGRRRATQDHSWERIAQRYLELLGPVPTQQIAHE